MPRNAGGQYTLPAGNPVVTNTVITSTWANPTMADLGNEISNSLSRDGQGGMRVPLEFFDGSRTAPGITFTNQTTVGMYRPASNVVGIAAQNRDIALFKGATGNVETFAAAPVADNDLAQKIWVEAAIAAAVAAAAANGGPVGTHYIGPDPNSRFTGTWVQLAEGTFLMNTVAGADLSGGNNNAVAIEHNHTLNNPPHGHGINDPSHGHGLLASKENGNYGGRIAYTSSTDNFQTNAVQAAATGVTVQNGTTAVTANAAGVSGTGLNRPKYVGVEVWKRTV